MTVTDLVTVVVSERGAVHSPGFSHLLCVCQTERKKLSFEKEKGQEELSVAHGTEKERKKRKGRTLGAWNLGRQAGWAGSWAQTGCGGQDGTLTVTGRQGQTGTRSLVVLLCKCICI